MKTGRFRVENWRKITYPDGRTSNRPFCVANSISAVSFGTCRSVDVFATVARSFTTSSASSCNVCNSFGIDKFVGIGIDAIFVLLMFLLLFILLVLLLLLLLRCGGIVLPSDELSQIFCMKFVRVFDAVGVNDGIVNVGGVVAAAVFVDTEAAPTTVAAAFADADASAAADAALCSICVTY